MVLICLLSWCGLGACHACHDKAKFTENGFHMRLLFAFSVLEVYRFVFYREVLPFPIYFHNIFLDYDVSLHILIVLVVTIPTSPRLSKTEFICKSYGVLFFLLDLPWSWSGVSGHTGVSGPNDRSLLPLEFPAFLPKCGAPLVSVWRFTGDGPESPVQPESPPK